MEGSLRTQEVSTPIMADLVVDRLTVLFSFQRSAGQSPHCLLYPQVLRHNFECCLSSGPLPRLLSFFNRRRYMNSSLFDFLYNQRLPQD